MERLEQDQFFTENQDRFNSEDAISLANFKTEFQLKSTFRAFFSVQFWAYFFMMLLSQMFGGFFSYVYKQLGLAVGIPDSVLTWAASMSSLVQAVTRLSFGALYDIYGFKRLYIILLSINVVNGLICYYARTITWLYFICILLDYLVIAGVFAIFPVPVATTFGSKFGTSVYPLVLLGAPLSALLITVETEVLYPRFGSQIVIYVGVGCSLLAIVIATLFNPQLDVNSMQRRGHVVVTMPGSRETQLKTLA